MNITIHTEAVHLHSQPDLGAALANSLAGTVFKTALRQRADVGNTSEAKTSQNGTVGAGSPLPTSLIPGQFYAHAGGIYIGRMPARGSVQPYHLFAAQADASEQLTFGPDIEVAGATDHWLGKDNTALLLAAGKHPAAEYCKAFSADGRTDWYLPAHAELALAWINCADAFNKDGYYWSSTQDGRYGAWVQDFEYGRSHNYSKDYTRRVRPFRRLFI